MLRALQHTSSANYRCDTDDLMPLLGAPDLQSMQTSVIWVHVMQVDWGKGRALSHMLKALSLDDCEDVIPIYLGDDRTDEDAFKVLKQRGSGFGVLISNKVSQSNTLPAMHACMHISNSGPFCQAIQCKPQVPSSPNTSAGFHIMVACNAAFIHRCDDC
jgi:hypothetical protein